jgi:hypothetical protein
MGDGHGTHKGKGSKKERQGKRELHDCKVSKGVASVREDAERLERISGLLYGPRGGSISLPVERLYLFVIVVFRSLHA